MSRSSSIAKQGIPMGPRALFVLISIALFIFARSAFPLVSDNWAVFLAAMPIWAIGSGLALLVGWRSRHQWRTDRQAPTRAALAVAVGPVLVGMIFFSVGATQIINGFFDRSPVVVQVVAVVDKTETYSPRGQHARCIWVRSDPEAQAEALREICATPFSPSVFPVSIWRALQPRDRLQVRTQTGALGLERLLGIERLPDS